MNPKTYTPQSLENLEELPALKSEPKQKPMLVEPMVKKAEGQKPRTSAQIEASRANGKKGKKLPKQTEFEKRESLLRRLLNGYIKSPNGCWIWQGLTTHRGYGILRNCYKSVSAHKASFILHGGVLTNDKPFVLHSCHDRRCINPQHLRAGTAQDNSNDMVAANRQSKGEKSGNSKVV